MSRSHPVCTERPFLRTVDGYLEFGNVTRGAGTGQDPELDGGMQCFLAGDDERIRE
jgi:hypothetical protein